MTELFAFSSPIKKILPVGNVMLTSVKMEESIVTLNTEISPGLEMVILPSVSYSG